MVISTKERNKGGKGMRKCNSNRAGREGLFKVTFEQSLEGSDRGKPSGYVRKTVPERWNNKCEALR